MRSGSVDTEDGVRSNRIILEATAAVEFVRNAISLFSTLLQARLWDAIDAGEPRTEIPRSTALQEYQSETPAIALAAVDIVSFKRKNSREPTVTADGHVGAAPAASIQAPAAVVSTPAGAPVGAATNAPATTSSSDPVAAAPAAAAAAASPTGPALSAGSSDMSPEPVTPLGDSGAE